MAAQNDSNDLYDWYKSQIIDYTDSFPFIPFPTDASAFKSFVGQLNIVDKYLYLEDEFFGGRSHLPLVTPGGAHHLVNIFKKPEIHSTCSPNSMIKNQLNYLIDWLFHVHYDKFYGAFLIKIPAGHSHFSDQSQLLDQNDILTRMCILPLFNVDKIEHLMDVNLDGTPSESSVKVPYSIGQGIYLNYDMPHRIVNNSESHSYLLCILGELQIDFFKTLYNQVKNFILDPDGL